MMKPIMYDNPCNGRACYEDPALLNHTLTHYHINLNSATQVI